MWKSCWFDLRELPALLLWLSCLPQKMSSPIMDWFAWKKQALCGLYPTLVCCVVGLIGLMCIVTVQQRCLEFPGIFWVAFCVKQCSLTVRKVALVPPLPLEMVPLIFSACRRFCHFAWPRTTLDRVITFVARVDKTRGATLALPHLAVATAPSRPTATKEEHEHTSTQQHRHIQNLWQ